MQIPRCHMPCFQNVCPGFSGPRPQQVPSIPEHPSSLQQTLRAQGPAKSPPCSDAEPAPLSNFSVESAAAAAAAESVLLSEVFLPASTPQPTVCIVASCSCKAPRLSWPAVAPTAQGALNPGSYANRDVASTEQGNSSYHLTLHIPRAERSILAYLKAGKMLSERVIC